MSEVVSNASIGLQQVAATREVLELYLHEGTDADTSALTRKDRARRQVMVGQPNGTATSQLFVPESPPSVEKLSSANVLETGD